MVTDLSQTLVVGISSRSLFNLEKEDAIYRKEGVEAYRQYQREHENDPLQPGTAFYLAQALLGLNRLCPDHQLVEVIVMSRNSPETGVRVLNSINTIGLDISRSAFTGGEPIAPYMEAFGVDLFLSKNEDDVQAVIDSRTAAAALLLDPPEKANRDTDVVRIAFDADAVLFSEDSEVIYKQEGLEAFQANEKRNTDVPLREGPHAKFLRTLAKIQSYMRSNEGGDCPLRIAIVTARSGDARLRVINTLRGWDVYVDEAFFLGGVSKDKVLEAFRAHIFFDDQDVHLESAHKVVASGKVPYPKGSKLK
ncbi:MAG: 5'-nucleotidase [Paludibacteraceae bacterium]|nr:5'-nucleotidase [Paludibacteraceae bacterium]